MTIDSTTVLWGQTVIYTIYVVAIMLLMGWFGYRVTRGEKSVVNPKLFYGFVGLLVTIGVSLHVITYNTIPWAKTDLHGDALVADKVFDITVADHKFTLPSDQLSINCNDLAQFNVTSEDLTYGFGLFRQNQSMVFQMQVVPGHPNIIRWEFNKNGVYSIRSTEYSGPAGAHMIVPDSVVVTGCAE